MASTIAQSVKLGIRGKLFAVSLGLITVVAVLSGVMVETVMRTMIVDRVGEQLMIKFEGIETVQAEVCWVEGFIAGLKFQRPFHPAVFDLLVARLGQAQL